MWLLGAQAARVLVSLVRRIVAIVADHVQVAAGVVPVRLLLQQLLQALLPVHELGHHRVLHHGVAVLATVLLAIVRGGQILELWQRNHLNAIGGAGSVRVASFGLLAAVGVYQRRVVQNDAVRGMALPLLLDVVN